MDQEKQISDILPADFEQVVAQLQGHEISPDRESAVNSTHVLEISAGIQRRQEERIRNLKPGDLMPQFHACAGWFYGGISPSTDKPFYIAVSDAPGIYTWDHARKMARRQNVRLPSIRELEYIADLRKYCSMRHTFNNSEDTPGWYWSSSLSDEGAAKYLMSSNNVTRSGFKGMTLAVRLVRD